MGVCIVKMFATGVAVVAAIGIVAAGPTAAGLAAADPAPVPAPVEPVTPAASTPPSADEVAGMLTRLTDAGISYKEKGSLVENGIDQQDGHVLDHELRRAYRDGELPYAFNVLSVSPTTPGHAIAPVAISGPKSPSRTVPLDLVDQGSWVISQDSAKALVQVLENR